MKGFIIHPTYRVEGNKAFVHLFGRLENGESFLTINEYKPYFFIKKADLDKALKIEQFDYEETKLKDYGDEPVVKIILSIPADVAKLRDKFSNKKIATYEADIRFAYRFMIDKLLQGGVDIDGKYETGRTGSEDSKDSKSFVKGEQVNRIYTEPELKPIDYFPKNLKVLSIDIETDKKGKELYCIALHSDDFKKVIIRSKEKLKNAIGVESEQELLLKFKELVLEQDPDIITGWNFIDFDLNILEKKFKDYKLPFTFGRDDSPCKLRLYNSFFQDSKADCSGRMVLDGIQVLKTNFVSLEDYKLNTAAQVFLNDSKIFEGDDRWELVEEAFKKNPQLLADYNLKDAELVTRILEKTTALELSIQRSLLTGMPLDRVRASIASLDSLYLKELRKRGFVAATASFEDRDDQGKGGYVMSSKPGIYDFIIVCDFKSLYPSIIRTFNIDPWSFLADCKGKHDKKAVVQVPSGACFKNQEGILPEIIQRLWEQREKARKQKNELARFAIKILMNSFYGVLANPTCRFYSREMANAITLTGQHIIKLTAKKAEEMGYEVIYGDSVTSERPIIIREKGLVEIVSIEDLFNRFKDKRKIVLSKERIFLEKLNIESLTVNPKTGKSCFRNINELIRHKTDKKIYRVNQKYGETRCTEDHSLMVEEEGRFKELTVKELKQGEIAHISAIPQLSKISKIDLYDFLKGYSVKTRYKDRVKTLRTKCNDEFVWFSWTNRKKPVLLKRIIHFPSQEGKALLRLLGFYAAEGSSSTLDTARRWGAALCSQDVHLLSELKKDYELLFKNSAVHIIPSSKGLRKLSYKTSSGRKELFYEDKTYKLNMMNQIAAVFFKQLDGQKSIGKKVPVFIFHLEKKEQELFLKYFLLGDGSRESKESYTKDYREKNFRLTTKSLLLASGLSFLIKQLGFSMSIRYRPSKQAYTIASSSRNNANLKTKTTIEPYKGYVYDLNIDGTNMFADACGQILLHNTDSIFLQSHVDDYKQAHKAGDEIASKINDFFGEMIRKEYERKNYLELQFDKAYKRFIMPMVRGSEVGSKKRYAGLLIDADGHEKMDFVGLEFVRRDWTELAKTFQAELLNRIFHKEEVADYIKQLVQEVREGKHDKLLVYKKAVRKEIDDYTKTTPPHVKAARLLGKDLRSNIIEYLMTKEGPEPIQKLKHKIDYEHYIDKQIKPLADAVLVFYNQSFYDIIKGSSQKTLFGY